MYIAGSCNDKEQGRILLVRLIKFAVPLLLLFYLRQGLEMSLKPVEWSASWPTILP